MQDIPLTDKIREKILTKKWHFDGLAGYSRYVADDGKTRIPQGVRQILDILNSTSLSEEKKIMQIHDIAKIRKGARLASILSVGLFMRSDDTKNFYDQIYKDITRSVKIKPRKP